jgi:hypothetical protein
MCVYHLSKTIRSIYLAFFNPIFASISTSMSHALYADILERLDKAEWRIEEIGHKHACELEKIKNEQNEFATAFENKCSDYNEMIEDLTAQVASLTEYIQEKQLVEIEAEHRAAIARLKRKRDTVDDAAPEPIAKQARVDTAEQ